MPIALADESPNVAGLCAWVYYRSLQRFPSLLRQAWESVRDKQTSQALAAFTSKTFSPLLIEREMKRVVDRDANGSDDDDKMNVKVLSPVNEIKITVGNQTARFANLISCQYIVDEQNMDITIRLPPEFPLAPVEIREGSKIGVTEQVWRSWLFNLQMTVSIQVIHLDFTLRIHD